MSDWLGLGSPDTSKGDAVKEKGGKRLYTLDATRRAKYIYIPECRRKGFSNLVDLATIFRLRDLYPSLKRW